MEQQNIQTKTEQTSVPKSNGETKRQDGPDMGWAWVVAFAACMINLIMAGLNRISGILYVAFIEIFNVDRKRASMPFSVKSSAQNLFGPIVGILGQKYGARKVIIAGSIIGALSGIGCFFAPDIIWITVLWGGMSGLGGALTVTLPQVVIGQYFDKHRTTASGIAFSGGCVGSFLFPVLLEYLLHNYGIEGTFLVIGAIILNVLPSALLFREPSWLKDNLQTATNPGLNLKQSLDKSVKDFNSNDVSETKDISVNEGTPKKFVQKTSIRELSVKEGGLNGLINARKVTVQSVNECTPKKNARISKVESEINPDVEFLRQNGELVFKMLSLVENIKDCDTTESCVMQEMENLYRTFSCSEEKSQYHKNLKQVKGSLFSVGDHGCKGICSQNKSLNSDRLSGSDPDIHGTAESKSLLLSMLSDLNNADEQQILANFPEHKVKALHTLKELLRLNKLCPRVSHLPELDYIDDDVFVDDVFEDKELGQIKPSTNDVSSNSFWDLIKTAFKLYVNPLFLMVCACRAVHFIAFIPAMTIVVDFTMDKGLSEDDGKFSIAAISLGDLLGRLCLGWITDRGYLSMPKYMMVVMFLHGISTASLPMMYSEISIFTNLAIFGLLQGSLFVRHPVLISTYLRKEEQSIAMGCVNFISGILGFGLPLYIGYFRDTMGSYNCIFYINGMLGVFVGLLWAFEPYFVKCVNAKRSTQKIGD